MKELEKLYKTSVEAVEEMNQDNELLKVPTKERPQKPPVTKKSVLISHTQARALRYGGPHGS